LYRGTITRRSSNFTSASDVVSLTWESVDLAEGTIVYTQGKTGRKVEVPIHPDLQEYLLSR
jgi:integrase